MSNLLSIQEPGDLKLHEPVLTIHPAVYLEDWARSKPTYGGRWMRFLDGSAMP